MKKVANFVIVIWLLLSSVLIAKNYMSLTLPTGVHIQMNISTDQNKIMGMILSKCKKYNLDI